MLTKPLAFCLTVILKALSPFPTPAIHQTIHKHLEHVRCFIGEEGKPIHAPIITETEVSWD